MIAFWALSIIVIMHISCLFLIQTSFVPDEYWQSLEIAHKMVFNYGYVTWEWEEGLRSFIYPFLISLLYKILQFLEVDSSYMMVLAPRFLQACISILSDAFFFSWVTQYNHDASFSALFSICTAWFWLYCSTRTLVNTMETSLTVIALYYFPWVDEKNNSSPLKFISIVGVACMIRPTAIIPWIPLCLRHIQSDPRKHYRSLLDYVLVGSLCLVSLTLIDCYFYNRFIITPYNFLTVNVFQSVSNFYGSHSAVWYLLNGFPTVLGLHLVPFILECLHKGSPFDPNMKIKKLLLQSMLFTVGVYSFVSHKEFRFILPILPMALYSSSLWICRFQKKSRYASAALCSVLALISAVQCLYLGVFHQRGTLDVIRDLAEDARADPAHTDLLFLMPCHSTPLYSQLHVNVSTRFLTCDPRDIFHSNLSRDEADEFYHAPPKWLEKNLNRHPSHVILFDVLYPEIVDFFTSRDYKVYSCYCHAHFTEGRVGQVVYVLKHK